MLDALKMDKDVLYYNVFGVVEISEDRVTVFSNGMRAGVLIPRTVTYEFKNPLRDFTVPFVVPFAGWLDRKNINVIFGQARGYNAAIFKENFEVIEKTAIESIRIMAGALEE